MLAARSRSSRGAFGAMCCSSRINAIGIRNGPNTLGSLNRPLARSPLSALPLMNWRPGIGTCSANEASTAEATAITSQVTTTRRAREEELTKAVSHRAKTAR